MFEDCSADPRIFLFISLIVLFFSHQGKCRILQDKEKYYYVQCGGARKKKKGSGSEKGNEKRPGGEVSQNKNIITHSLMESPYKQKKTLKFKSFSLLKNKEKFQELKKKPSITQTRLQTKNIINCISF